MTTFALIQQFANERHNLYKLAAKQTLTTKELARLHELNDRLPVLWDTYRRELAARAAPQPEAAFLMLPDAA